MQKRARALKYLNKKLDFFKLRSYHILIFNILELMETSQT